MFERRRWLLRSIMVFVAMLALGGAAFAEDAVTRGRQIAEEADRRSRGFGDYRARMDMILRDRLGKEVSRELSMSVLETGAGEEKSLVVFHSPPDIRGTALLTYSHADRDEEQWLYLPALRRTKRIAVSGRSTPFMGSEFFYEDLVTMHVNQFGYRFLRDADLRGADCYVIERVPKYQGSGYSRQEVWMDQSEYRVLKIDYWDRKARYLKTLELGGYNQYLGKFWEPAQARMVNHLTKESTLLRWSDYRFKSGLTERDFSRSALGRVR